MIFGIFSGTLSLAPTYLGLLPNQTPGVCPYSGILPFKPHETWGLEPKITRYVEGKTKIS
jgi:hypothetical protein